jgi:hypothetical protein
MQCNAMLGRWDLGRDGRMSLSAVCNLALSSRDLRVWSQTRNCGRQPKARPSASRTVQCSAGGRIADLETVIN